MSEKKTSVLGSVCYLIWVFWGSSIGRKIVMGVTGLGLIGFLIFHLIGNSFLLKGESVFNTYARLLHSIPVLPAIEFGLGILFVLHVITGIALTVQNAAARPVDYQVKATAGRATVASRSMIYTGGIILIFLAYHLWSLHAGWLPRDSSWTRVRHILADPVSVAIYTAGFFALGTHLFHGLSSMMVTLWLRHPRHDAWVDVACRVIALILAVGFAGLAFFFFLK